MCGGSAPAPQEPVEVPQRSDEETKSRASGDRKRRALANGGNATYATGGLGDTSEANVGRGAVLGGSI